MPILYAILPINWDYNDEYYSDEGYQKPESFTSDKALADRICREKNLKEFNTDYFGEGGAGDELKEGYTLDDLYAKIKEVFPDFDITLEDLDEHGVQLYPKDASLDDIEKVVSMLNFWFYEVVEVPELVA